MNKGLPKMESLIIPAFKTLLKGKKISKEGIHLKHFYNKVEIDKIKLDRFINYFNFTTNTPVSYLYVFAQRAQTSLMLDKKFTLAIPGMIHIENSLVLYSDYSTNHPIDIKVAVNVDYKQLGGLKPVFFVEIHQKGKHICSCKSVYIVKRKSRKSSKRSNKEKESIETYSSSLKWQLDSSIAKEYAKISGDKNPIHTSSVFAKMLGFKSSIIHGWYSICEIEHIYNKVYKKSASEIHLNFNNAITLPSKPIMEFELSDDDSLVFQVKNREGSKLFLKGSIKPFISKSYNNI